MFFAMRHLANFRGILWEASPGFSAIAKLFLPFPITFQIM